MTTTLQECHPELTEDHKVLELALFISPIISMSVDGDQASPTALATYGQYAAGFLSALEKFISDSPVHGLATAYGGDVDVSDDEYQVTAWASLAFEPASDLDFIYSNFLHDYEGADEQTKKAAEARLERELSGHIQNSAKSCGYRFSFRVEWRGEADVAA